MITYPSKILCIILLLIVNLAFAQTRQNSPVSSSGEGENTFLRGTIRNYRLQPLYLFKCHTDTLLLVDSTMTNNQGKFSFSKERARVQVVNSGGLYKIALKGDQFFEILYDPAQENAALENGIEIRTLFYNSPYYNIATDSLEVVRSEVNKTFYQFQRIQFQYNIANYYLLGMLKQYPPTDPFHRKIEDEYLNRFKKMDSFIKGLNAKKTGGNGGSNLEKLYALAYYIPVNPEWKLPDDVRDSIIADHFFDVFNPAHPFYLNTNVLPEMMESYLSYRTNKRDANNQPIKDEVLFASAAVDFINKTTGDKQQSIANGNESFRFCLNYYLKKFGKDHQDNAFMILYDKYFNNVDGDCGSFETDQFTWARKKASVLRGVQSGSIAPDFALPNLSQSGQQNHALNLVSVKSKYTLLVFWATWCPHCAIAIPELKHGTDSINSNQTILAIVAVSLDTERAAWLKYIKDKKLDQSPKLPENSGLGSWINTSELKGWKGEIHKQYNVFATPTMFLLDNSKKIIAKPDTPQELFRFMKTVGR